MRSKRPPLPSVTAALLALLGLAAAIPCRAADPAAPAAPSPAPLDGWPFRVTATATQAAHTYDVPLDHTGLAQPDARDLRVLSPAGQPVNHFVAYADATRVRLLFDGSPGPGAYAIHFGNLSPALQPFPEVAALGDKAWQPKGGYRSTSFGQVLPLTRRDTLGHQAARAALARNADAARAKADEAGKPEDRAKFVRHSLLRSTAADLTGGAYHEFRAKVAIPAAGEYEIVLGSGAASELGLLYLDAADDAPLIDGSFKTPDAFMVIATAAKAILSAGPHEFRMFTTRRTPGLRLRSSEPGAPPARHLTGLDAHYDDAVRLAPGPIDAGATLLADAYLAAVRGWADLGRFAHARALARFARAQLPAGGDGAHAAALDAEIARAGRDAYDRNWLTEGKYRTRTNAVPAATAFTPPLRMAAATADAPTWDARHNSSAVSVEGRVVYGLPVDVMHGRPWGLTGATSVDDDVLFVGAKNGVMHAVYLAAAAEKWQFAGGGACLGPPLVSGGVLYYGALDRRLYAVDADRGRMLWNFPTGGWIEGGPAADPDGARVYFGSRDGRLHALDARRGVERWHADLAAPIVATPAVAAGKVFVGTRGGTFAAFDAATGKPLWKFDAGAPISGGCATAGDRVWFGDEAGRLHALHAATGKPAWPAPADLKSPILGAPILVGGTLFVGTAAGTLFGVDAADGAVGWDAPMPGGGCVARPAIFANDTLTFTSRAASPLGPDGKPADLRGNTASFVMGPGPNNLRWARALSAITPDGHPTEPAWQVAERLAPLLKPNGLSAPDAPADVRLLWDEQNLYVAATIRTAGISPSPDPANPRAGHAFSLLIAPRRNGSIVYELVITPDGNKTVAVHPAPGLDRADPKNKPLLDQLTRDEKQLAWSPDALIATKRTSDGWSAEIVIPLHGFPKPIPIPAGNASWRVNAIVTARRTAAAIPLPWSLIPPTPTEPLGSLARWPTVTFDPKPKP